MIRYPALVERVAGVDLLELACRAGVEPASLAAVVAGDVPASPSLQLTLGRALDANPLVLFRLDDELESALDDAPSRYVTDPAALRAIDDRALAR